MTSRELIRWSTLHERRGRAAWASPVVAAIAIGAALAAWVAARGYGGGAVSASHAWLAGAIAATSIASLRVPFLLYWRADAAVLAQLPLDGAPLLDAALWRCARAAATTTSALCLGAIPLLDGALIARHVAFAAVLGTTVGALVPAVAIYAASIVAADRRGGLVEQMPSPPTTLLGALPGFATVVIVVLALYASPWLVGRHPDVDPLATLGGLAAASAVALLAARAAGPRVMAKILRDVSALDRQRLASLDVRPPTALERAIGGMLGDAALVYAKDARLMRRRYPMAFALGAVAFIVLAIVGIAKPEDPAPWLATVLAGAAIYAAALAGRLGRPPIELVRLSDSLPITRAARARARRAWLVGWIAVFIAVPAAFALLRVL